MADPFRIRGVRQWDELGERRQEKYIASLEALNVSRTEHLSIRAAAKDVGISYGTAMRYIGPATERNAFGQTVAKAADRLFRPLEIPTPEGRQLRATYGSQVGSTVGGYEGALGRFLETGDERGLAQYQGKRAGGVVLPTDPDLIEDMARKGILRELEPYPKAGR